MIWKAELKLFRISDTGTPKSPKNNHPKPQLAARSKRTADRATARPRDRANHLKDQKPVLRCNITTYTKIIRINIGKCESGGSRGGNRYRRVQRMRQWLPPWARPVLPKTPKIPLIFVDFSLIFAHYALKQGGGADRKNNIGPNHFRKVPRNDDS